MTQPERYKMVYCDCPWRYSQAWSGKKVHGAASAQYATMSDEELRSIPVQDWADPKGCVLALWATLPRLDSALDLLRGWGFTYKTAIPWAKTVPSTGTIQRGIGIWFMQSTELCLFGQMGKVGGFKERRGVQGFLVGDDRVLYAPGRKHSEKPRDLYEYLEEFPGPYLELFGRAGRPGWTTWGIEAPIPTELGPWGVRPCPTR